MTPLRPLSEGNRFQRWYAAWAAPHYARMPCEARESAELMDRFLYSRRGLGVWIGLLCALVGSAAGLRGTGLPWGLAVLAATLFWLAIAMVGLTAWLVPSAVAGRKLLGKLGLGAVLGILGSITGFAVGHVAKRGELNLAALAESLWDKLGVLMPAALGVILGMGLLMFGVAHVRRGTLQQQLERTALEREAAEAKLRLLRAQIQPHFIFNTLSALQHWVDTGDARAPGLLRSLTGFLRGSTELLGRDEVTLEAEAAMVAHYLAIQQARLGARLASEIDIAPDASAALMPPGVLLTLVENAVEHGVAPALQGGTVRVHAQREGGDVRICVDDTGVGPAPDWREGVGLSNCRQRLAHRFGTQAGLQLEPREPGTRACITLPVTAP
jgi:signal transduction histidine kinase